MITPSEDKEAIKAILDTDPFIARAGFTAENIRTTKFGTDTLNSNTQDFQIFISMGYPENPNNWLQKGIVYNIAVTGKRSRAAVIDNVATQIIALLTEVELFHSHILYLLDPPLELDSDPAVYVVQVSFICYETIFNQVRE